MEDKILCDGVGA